MSSLWAGPGPPRPPQLASLAQQLGGVLELARNPWGSLPMRRTSLDPRHREQLQLHPSCPGFWPSVSKCQSLGSVQKTCVCACETVSEKREMNMEKPTHQPTNWGHSNSLQRKPRRERCSLCLTLRGRVRLSASRTVHLSLVDFLTNGSSLLPLLSAKGQK